MGLESKSEDNNFEKFRQSDITKLKEGKEDAESLEKTRSLGQTIKNEILNTITGKDAQQKWMDRLEQARDKNQISHLEAVRNELKEWKRASDKYMSQFKDKEVWRDETIEEYKTWLEDLTPYEIDSYQRMWDVTQYQPRREIVDKFKSFPKDFQNKNKNFENLDFTARQALVEKMEKDQITEFEKEIDKAPFSEQDKEFAKQNFKKATITERAVQIAQLAESIKTAQEQNKEFEKQFKKITKISGSTPNNLNKKFLEGSFKERTKIIESTTGILSYFDKLENYTKDGIISEGNTKKEYQKWIIDIAINAGTEGVDWALRELPNQMYDRKRLVTNFNKLVDEAQSIMSPETLATEKKKFEESGYHERLEQYTELNDKISNLKKSLNLSEHIPTSVQGLLGAAEKVFEEAQNYENTDSRNAALKLSRNAYENVLTFAKDVNNSQLLHEAERKIQEINNLINGKAESSEENIEESTETKVQNIIKEHVSKNEKHKSELFYLTLMDKCLQHSEQEEQRIGQGSQEKRANQELTKDHHQELNEQLQETNNTESDRNNRKTLNKEGKAEEIVEMDMQKFGTTADINKDKTVKHANTAKERINVSDSDKTTAQLKFIDNSGRELMPKEAKEALQKRQERFQATIAKEIIENPKIIPLFPNAKSNPETALTAITNQIGTMREQGTLAADLSREQAKAA